MAMEMCNIFTSRLLTCGMVYGRGTPYRDQIVCNESAASNGKSKQDKEGKPEHMTI